MYCVDVINTITKRGIKATSNVTDVKIRMSIRDGKTRVASAKRNNANAK
jgi:hypothetical protein